MKNNRPLVALGLVVLLVAAFAVRWEEWDYLDARGGRVFQYRGCSSRGSSLRPRRRG
jgi:hypothetical protein